MKNAPAFQFYPESFLTGTALFTNEEKGIYMVLLCLQWSHGRLPGDIAAICRLASCSAKRLDRVLTKFVKDDTGAYFNERLEKEKIKQDDYRKKQSELSKRRWSPDAKANPKDDPIGHALAYPLADNLAMPARKNTEYRDEFCRREGIGEGMRKEGFPDAWSDWLAYRADVDGTMLNPRTAKEHMLKLERIFAAHGLPAAVRAIRDAISGQWKQPLEPHEKFGFGNKGPASPTPRLRPASEVSSIADAKPADEMLGAK